MTIRIAEVTEYFFLDKMGSIEKSNASSLFPSEGVVVPLLINGEDYIATDPDRHFSLAPEHNPTTPSKTILQGADVKITLKAIDGAQQALAGWSRTSVATKRALFQKMVEVGVV